MSKQILLVIGLLIACTGVKAQMTLEHHYTAVGYAGVVNLSNSGKKIAMFDTVSKQLKLYNTDNTLWKTISFPSLPGYTHYSYDPGFMVWGGADYISEGLFNTDNLIEFTTWYWSTSNFNEGQRLVLNENGVIINSFQNNFYVYNAGNNVFKAMVHKGYSNYDFDVYSLPGTIPCDPCSNGLGFKEAVNPGQIISEPVPNPSAGQTTIHYQLPSGAREGEISLYNASGQEIRRLRVGAEFKYITLENADVPSGIYYYQIRCNGIASESKKMILIK